MAYTVTTYNDESELLAGLVGLPGTESVFRALSKGAKFTIIIDDTTAGADQVGKVETFSSPQDLLDYMNSITLPPRWDVVDKGNGKFTWISDTLPVAGVNTFTVRILNDISELEILAQQVETAVEVVYFIEYGLKFIAITTL